MAGAGAGRWTLHIDVFKVVNSPQSFTLNYEEATRPTRKISKLRGKKTDTEKKES